MSNVVIKLLISFIPESTFYYNGEFHLLVMVRGKLLDIFTQTDAILVYILYILRYF